MEDWQHALKAEPLQRLFAATELEAHSSHVVFASQTQSLLREVEVSAAAPQMRCPLQPQRSGG